MKTDQVDVLIESTQNFENDLDSLSEDGKRFVIKKINDFANFFPTQTEKTEKIDTYPDLHRPLSNLNLNGYESSLYILKVSPAWRVILAVDEDPIFSQIVLTLFRLVELSQANQAYQATANSLYQELRRDNPQTVPIS